MSGENRQFTVFAPSDDKTTDLVPKSKWFHIKRKYTPTGSWVRHNVFFLVNVNELARCSEAIKKANRLNRLRALFICTEQDWSTTLFQRMHYDNVHTLKWTHLCSSDDLPRRIMHAYNVGAENDLIAKAEVAGDHLFVVNCASDSFKVAFDEVPALRAIKRNEWRNFELAPDGAYLHWPAPDIHIDLETIRYATDKNFRVKSDAAKLAHDERYGGAIAALRKQSGLRQTDIAGLSERQVRRIEQGHGTTVKSLHCFADAHAMELNDYLNELARLVTA